MPSTWPPGSVHPTGAACRSMEDGGKGPKRLYLVSAGVRRLLLNDVREALKVTMTGLKLFERQEVRVRWLPLLPEWPAWALWLIGFVGAVMSGLCRRPGDWQGF